MWVFAVAAGVGFWQGRGGWWVGATSVGVSYLGLLVHTAVVAPIPFERMGDILGALMGGMPGVVVHAATVMVGLLIGLTGGGLGASVRFAFGGQSQ